MQTGFSFKLSRALVYLAVFLIPFYFFRFSVGPLRTNVFEVAVFLSFVSCILYLVSCRIKIKFGSVWPFLFLLVAFISIFFSSDKTIALGIFKGWFLAPIALYFLILNLFAKKDLYRLTLTLLFSLMIVGLWSLAQDFGLISALFYQKGDASFLQYLRPDNFRIFGPFESPNYLAMYLVPVLFLCLPLLMHFRKMPKLRTLALLLVFGIAIYDLVMTGSRAGIIAFVVTITVLVLTKVMSSSGRQRSDPGIQTMDSRHSTVAHGLSGIEDLRGNDNRRWLTIISLVVVVLMFILVLSRVSSDRSESNSSRLQIYHYSMEIGKTQPVIGIGLGSFQTKIAEISKNDIDFQVKTLPYALHPHNIFLAMWLNLGILGLIIFIIIIWNFFRQLWPQRNYYLALCLMAAMSAILIHGLFDTTYFKNDLSAFFWLILAFSELISLSDNAKN